MINRKLVSGLLFVTALFCSHVHADMDTVYTEGPGTGSDQSAAGSEYEQIEEGSSVEDALASLGVSENDSSVTKTQTGVTADGTPIYSYSIANQYSTSLSAATTGVSGGTMESSSATQQQVTLTVVDGKVANKSLTQTSQATDSMGTTTSSTTVLSQGFPGSSTDNSELYADYVALMRDRWKAGSTYNHNSGAYICGLSASTGAYGTVSTGVVCN